MTAQPGPENRSGHRERQLRDHGVDHAQGTGRPPEYVVEAWVSEQLCDRIERNKTSRGEPSHEANTHITRRQTRAQQPDLEAEP
jgi:hypothetical protein